MARAKALVASGAFRGERWVIREKLAAMENAARTGEYVLHDAGHTLDRPER